MTPIQEFSEVRKCLARLKFAAGAPQSVQQLLPDRAKYVWSAILQLHNYFKRKRIVNSGGPEAFTDLLGLLRGRLEYVQHLADSLQKRKEMVWGEYQKSGEDFFDALEKEISNLKSLLQESTDVDWRSIRDMLQSMRDNG